MPDFNKGDFTQQGVAGHVNANLRLNEKRLVNIDLTSNEEAEGCTITGTVKDLLNNKVYNIGSGGGGSLEPVTLLDITATSENDGNNYVIPLYDENHQPLYPSLYIPYSLMGLTFIYDNTEYNCESSDNQFGAPYIDNTYDYTNYPFNFHSGDYKFTCNDNEPTSHTIKIIMKPSIEKITITNSMAYDIPFSQSDAPGSNTPIYILAKGNDTEQYDVLLYSGYGKLYNYSYNGKPVIFSNLVNCHLDSFGTNLIITPNCSFTISQEPNE